MARYHISSKTLEPGECKAEKGNCPFGGDEEHYTTMEAARAQSEKLLEDLNGWAAQKNETSKIAKLVKELNSLETNPARYQTGFPEDELVRHNIAQKIHAKREEIKKSVPHGEFYYLLNSVQRDDLAEGENFVMNQLASRERAYSWEGIMGRGARRTKNSRAQYYSALTAVVRSNDKLQEEANKIAYSIAKRKAYGRAIKAGVELPEQYENAFEAIWSGTSSTSEFGLKKELAELKVLAENYDAGRVKPASIVGTGLRDPHGAAKEYIANRRSELEEALSTRGRSYSVNAENVSYKARKEGWLYSKEGKWYD